MKALNKLKKRVASNRGEILMETIISMMLLVILLALVTSVIQQALMMITRSSRQGRELQEDEANVAILGEYIADALDDVIISLSVSGVSGTSTHYVYFQEEFFTAFTPNPAGPSAP
jgi:uncharacterized membrane protein YdbT with pleckstrin-like domain